MTNTESTADLVCYFTAADAPRNPFTGHQAEGWYYRLSPTAAWSSPAPYGEEQARFNVAGGLRARRSA